MHSSPLEKLLQSKKYRNVCPDTVRRVWSACVEKYPREKDAEKAAREQLHGITGAFWNEREYQSALALAAAQDWAALLQLHASTRERMPIARMDEIYGKIWGFCGAPRSILDLACGLNPAYLRWRWPELTIDAVDIGGQCVEILRRFCGVQARLSDLLCEDGIPSARFHIALLLKVLPLLDRQVRGGATETLNRIRAEYIVVSFPTRSLSGRNVGMERHYTLWMQEHLPQNRSIAGRFSVENELFYILKEL